MIFIDANIYLRFFDSNQKLFKKLLDYLLEVKENIFLTKQIVDEVNRNKLTVFKNSIYSYKSKMKYEIVILPEHIASNSNKNNIVDWNQKRYKLKSSNNDLINELEEILIESLDKISNSDDNVSKKLKPLFYNAIRETEKELLEARKRKERGNPPGKNNDSLGDQITWEQFLCQISNQKEIWIISNDHDYFVSYNKQFFLNPFLYAELHDKNPSIKINCFNTLSDGLGSFFKVKQHKGFLSKKQVEEIKKEERFYQRTNISSSNIAAVGYDAENQILEIEFNHGGVYQYFEVPKEEYDSLMSASSHGSYFYHNIRGVYQYSKIR